MVTSDNDLLHEPGELRRPDVNAEGAEQLRESFLFTL